MANDIKPHLFVTIYPDNHCCDVCGYPSDAAGVHIAAAPARVDEPQSELRDKCRCGHLKANHPAEAECVIAGCDCPLFTETLFQKLSTGERPTAVEANWKPSVAMPPSASPEQGAETPTETCPTCHGSGGIPVGTSEEIMAGRLDRCDKCDGFGRIEPSSPERERAQDTPKWASVQNDSATYRLEHKGLPTGVIAQQGLVDAIALALNAEARLREAERLLEQDLEIMEGDATEYVDQHRDRIRAFLAESRR